MQCFGPLANLTVWPMDSILEGERTSDLFEELPGGEEDA